MWPLNNDNNNNPRFMVLGVGVESKDTEYWVRQLNNVQLPVLSGVMQEINAVTQCSESSAEQLSELIMRDSALTAKVLRLANSVTNTRGSNKINTISRAVVQLGFKGIKAISLSIMLVDSLLKNKDKERMMQWMARGFHTAVQAENLMQQVDNQADEEVFITALLLHVGDMAFWSMKGEHAKLLDGALDNCGEFSNPKLEQKVLGTTLKEVGVALADKWNLGEDLKEVLSPGHKPSLRTQAVLLGEKISAAAEKGWDSPEFTDVLVDASMFTGVGLQDMRAKITQGAERAAGVANTYGAESITRYIPKVDATASAPQASATTEEAAVVATAPVNDGVHADAKLQLEILREMGNMVEHNIDVNTLFTMLTEGIHKGVGFERVALCLIDPKVTMMTAKYILGEKTDIWREDLKMPVKAQQDNLFAYCLHKQVTVWMKRRSSCGLEHLVNKRMQNLIDTDNCVIAAIYTGKRTIGLLLADRGIKGPDITQEQFDSYSHFVQQANSSLAMLAAKSKR
ncbi:HDOD domain-containing protein [Dasania sp. GY-MA-18]|uniref:HDOD domain-containing protein n=1 Tax=Dasania phycosphaerae TaxID=2950436 RepID=A0A9J6RIY0_9GAMM|nr:MULTISPECIES: HDOD domain-containing protein [Dasania]MCR8921780.1 HDOD domain-containing protein [Dasania sp. GY-MA-18]MCZ0864208.1 HDOD domain-containing protein [Dasania phycosphaerae]MCZ0867936.1 HDOD domain-containing protein [Dasania phycosphaerae]